MLRLGTSVATANSQMMTVGLYLTMVEQHQTPLDQRPASGGVHSPLPGRERQGAQDSSAQPNRLPTIHEGADLSSQQRGPMSNSEKQHVQLAKPTKKPGHGKGRRASNKDECAACNQPARRQCNMCFT